VLYRAEPRPEAQRDFPYQISKNLDRLPGWPPRPETQSPAIKF